MSSNVCYILIPLISTTKAVEEYRPSARYAIVVEWDEDERDAEQAYEADCGHPKCWRKVHGVRMAGRQDDIGSCASDTEQDVEHWAAKTASVDDELSSSAVITSNMTHQAAYDMLGANDAIVRHEMRSAQEFPMANTVNEMSVSTV
jgi:hypothetical protein